MKPIYGWCWIEGEDDEQGNEWIQIHTISEDGYAEEEICVLMLRNVAKWGHLKADREARAQFIVDAMNEHAKMHPVV